MSKLVYRVFFLVLFFACTPMAFANSDGIYREVPALTKKSDYNTDNTVQTLDITHQTLAVKLRYISDRAYLSLARHDTTAVDWTPVKINFYYDMAFADAEKDIHLLLNNNDTANGYLLFPAFTEQFAGYFVYSFKGNTLDYAGHYEATDFNKGPFSFNEKTNALFRSSDTVSELHKADDTKEEQSPHLAADLTLLNADTSALTIDQYEKNKHYFITTLDVNKDGIPDKIVSPAPYQGNEIVIFLGDTRNTHRFAVKSTNFSEDGGNQISEIKETSDGYKIVTTFPDRGRLQTSYFITGLKNTFILKRIESRSYSWQDGYTESCLQKLNIDLNQSHDALFKKIANTEKKCIKTYENKRNEPPAHHDWIGTYEGTFLRLKDESADPRAWGSMTIKIGGKTTAFQLDSYKENVTKHLHVVSVDARTLHLAVLDDKTQTLTLTRDKNTYTLSGPLLKEIVGTMDTYSIEKKK